MDLQVVGHKAQRSLLLDLSSRNRLPSTMLFSGPAGVGKKTVAHSLATHLLCERRPSDSLQGCGKCSSCFLCIAGNHPDLHVVDFADKGTSAISAIRDLLYSLNLRAYRSSSRIVIFDNAESMSGQVANVLLKTLEEPRPGTYFCLITANPYRLPATLLSRSQIWHFDKLSDHEISDLLLKLRKNGHLADLVDDSEITNLLDGSVENIGPISQSIDDWREVSQKLESIAKGGVEDALSFASHLAKEREALRMRLYMIRIFSRRKLYSLKERGDLGKWSEVLANSLFAEHLIFDRNLNTYLVLLNLFLPLLPDSLLDSFTELTNNDNLLEKFAF